MEYDRIKIIQIPPVTHAWIAQIGEHHIQMAEVPGSMLTGVTFLSLEFLFLHGKACDAIIAIFRYNCILWKTRIEHNLGQIFLCED